MNISDYMEEFNAALNVRQRIEEARTLEDYLDTFAAVPPELNVADKGVYMAEPMRGQGDVLFDAGKYEEAIVTYTHSLRISPVYSTHAALAYAKRSAASFNLKAFEECILDIDRALDLPYPDHLRDKIKSRKAAAVSMLIKSPDQIMRTNPPVDELEFAHGASVKIPGASRGLDIAYNPEDGRILVAKMPFKEGDVLAVLNPYLLVPEMEEHPTFCHHCLKKSFFILPCDICNYEVYCSEKCRTEAFKMYHRLECKIQYTLVCSLPLNRHLLACQLRCLSIFTKQGTDLKGLQDDLKEIRQNSDPAKIGFTGKKFDGNTRRAFLSLGHHDKSVKYNPEALLGAAYIVTLLRNYTDFFKKNSDIPIVANLLAELSTIYGTHDILIPYYRGSATKSHATYPLLGLATHACCNNTITYIDNNSRVVLRASMNIKPGDKILFDCHEVDVVFGDITNRVGRFREVRTNCRYCESNVVSPLEKCTSIKMDKNERAKLKKDPCNVAELWKLLKHVNESLGAHSMQTQAIKKILIQLYEGRCNPIYAQQTLLLLGML